MARSPPAPFIAGKDSVAERGWAHRPLICVYYWFYSLWNPIQTRSFAPIVLVLSAVIAGSLWRDDILSACLKEHTPAFCISSGADVSMFVTHYADAKVVVTRPTRTDFGTRLLPDSNWKYAAAAPTELARIRTDDGTVTWFVRLVAADRTSAVVLARDGIAVIDLAGATVTPLQVDHVDDKNGEAVVVLALALVAILAFRLAFRRERGDAVPTLPKGFCRVAVWMLTAAQSVALLGSILLASVTFAGDASPGSGLFASLAFLLSLFLGTARVLFRKAGRQFDTPVREPLDMDAPTPLSSPSPKGIPGSGPMVPLAHLDLEHLHVLSVVAEAGGSAYRVFTRLGYREPTPDPMLLPHLEFAADGADGGQLPLFDLASDRNTLVVRTRNAAIVAKVEWLAQHQLVSWIGDRAEIVALGRHVLALPPLYFIPRIPMESVIRLSLAEARAVAGEARAAKGECAVLTEDLVKWWLGRVILGIDPAAPLPERIAATVNEKEPWRHLFRKTMDGILREPPDWLGSFEPAVVDRLRRLYPEQAWMWLASPGSVDPKSAFQNKKSPEEDSTFLLNASADFLAAASSSDLASRGIRVDRRLRERLVRDLTAMDLKDVMGSLFQLVAAPDAPEGEAAREFAAARSDLEELGSVARRWRNRASHPNSDSRESESPAAIRGALHFVWHIRTFLSVVASAVDRWQATEEGGHGRAETQ